MTKAYWILAVLAALGTGWGCQADPVQETSFVPETPAVSLVVADFDNASGDPIFEPTLKHALAVALADTPRLRVLPGERVVNALRELNRSADERLTPDLAWEVARHEEAGMIVLGRIVATAAGLVMTIDAIDAASGRTVARAEQRADGRDGVIDALGEAAWALKQALPAPAAPRSPAPSLTAQTTASLEAFAAYARGRELADKGRKAQATRHYEQALAADPGFRLARAALGQVP